MRHLFALPLACIVLAACAVAAPMPPGPAHPQAIKLAQHASATVAPGVTLRLEGVDDSRCPPDARCVWAGTLSYRLRLEGPGGTTETFTLRLEQPGYVSALLKGARIELNDALADKPPPGDAAQTTPVALRIKPA